MTTGNESLKSKNFHIEFEQTVKLGKTRKR